MKRTIILLSVCICAVINTLNTQLLILMGKHCTAAAAAAAAAAASAVCHIHLKTRASLNNSNNNHNCHNNIFWCEDPIGITKFLLLLLLQNELHFEGLNMLENSLNFAHTPEVVNIYI